MTRYLRRAVQILLLLAIVNPAPLSAAHITDGGQYLNDNVRSETLRNGIRVLMLNRGYAPTLGLIISFKVGSTDESYETMGMAHLLEHMLFKGTDRIGTTNYREEKKILDRIAAVGDTIDRLLLLNPKNSRIPELKKELQKLQIQHRKYTVSDTYDKIYTTHGGVGFNASTSRDRTAYYIELPSSKLELWADLESERLRNPVMRGFFLERNTVQEERLMRYDSDGVSGLYEKFLATAFIAHPYRHPTIGWASNIPHLSIYDVERFYRTNYIPARMTITVIGKQDTGKTLRTLEKYFGKMEPRPNPPETAIREPKQKGEKRFVYKFESNPYLLIGWHKPTFPSRYDYIFDIIANLLSDGKTSRLYKSLVLEKKIAASVNVWNGFPGARYDNLFVVAASPRAPYTVLELEKEIYQEMARLKKDLTRHELQKVISRIESSMVFDLDSNMGICNLLSYYQTIFNDWRYMTDYTRTVKSVTIEEINQAIDSFLVKDNRTVGMLEDSRNTAEN